MHIFGCLLRGVFPFSPAQEHEQQLRALARAESESSLLPAEAEGRVAECGRHTYMQTHQIYIEIP